MSNELSDPTGGTEAETHVEASEVEAAVEQNAEDTAAQETGTDETGQADETSDTPKRKPWWEKRFDELTAKRYDAERDAAYWRGIAEGRTPQAEAQQASAPPDRWEDPEGYDRWLISQAVEEARKDFAKQQNARTYEERVKAAQESKPDFDSVALNPSLPVTKDMAQVIFESELGPDILYYLGSNPSEATRISRLPAHLQAKELGKIEATLGNKAAPPPAQKRNPPPPPPNTVAGLSSGINKDPEGMSMAEYIAARNAGTI